MNISRFKEFLKKNANDRTDQDIKEMFRMISDLNFVKEIKNEEILSEICKNAEIKSFKEDELIYNSDDIITKEENYLVLKGTANLYSIDKKDKNKRNWLKSLNEGDEFGVSLTYSSIKDTPNFEKCLVYANSVSEIVIFRQNVIKFKSKIVKNSAAKLFDPDLFLIDNPSKIYELIEAVKDKIEKEFHIFRKYENTIEKFSSDQIV